MFPYLLPNPNSKWEMALLLAGMGMLELAKAAVRIHTLLGLVVFGVVVYCIVITLVALVLLYVAYLTLTRLAALYRRHGFTSTRTARLLQGALGVFGVVCMLAYVVGDYTNNVGIGLDVFGWSFLVFVVFCELVVRRAQTGQPSSVSTGGRVSLQNIVSWHKAVNQRQP